MHYRLERCGALALAAMVTAMAAAQAAAQTFTIDFGTQTAGLPYAEDGFTVTALSSGNGSIISGGDGDAELAGGTNTIPIRWQISRGGEPFTLHSLDVEDFARAWRIETAGAQAVNVTADGTIDFTGLPGWQNISSFQVVHDPGEANGFSRVDNVVVSIPEPCAAALAAAAAIPLLSRGPRRRRQS